MYKYVYGMIFIFISTLTQAQDFTLFSPTGTASQNNVPRLSSKILSPSEFQSQVSTVTRNNQIQSQNDLQKNTPQQPITSTPPLPLPSQTDNNTVPTFQPVAPPPSTTPPTTNAPYTGFQGNTTTPNNTPTSNNSTNWNIKY